MSNKNIKKNEADQVVELDDDRLNDIAGAGAAGGPICPACGSEKVVIDPQRHIIVKCFSCGYQAK